jgi:peptide/nickel transport system permease protein
MGGNAMVRFIFRRALSGLVILFLFLTFMFFFAQIIMTGDFVSHLAYNAGLSEEEVAAARQERGLDLPLWKQYYYWVRSLLNGQLGMSYHNVPVSAFLAAALPFTVLVFFTGTTVAFLIGQWLGKMTAWRGPGVLSTSVMLGGITLYTTFPPWLMFLMLYFFGCRLDVIRTLFDLDTTRNLWRNSSLTAQTVIWYMVATVILLLILMAVANWFIHRRWRRRIPALVRLLLLVAGSLGAWYALGFGPQAMDVVYFGAIPIITYTLLSFGETMLIMRTSMADTLHEEYILAARAKGLPERVVRDRHAARNAVLPVLSRLVVNLPYMLTGLAFIEYAFGIGGQTGLSLYASLGSVYETYWKGLGSTLYSALFTQDIPLALGVLLFVGLLSLVARLVLEVLYVALDPRLRRGADAAGRFR